MSDTRRIQRKRSSGWRKLENAIDGTRSSRWRNPNTVALKLHTSNCCRVNGEDWARWTPARKPWEYKHEKGLAKYLAEFETGRENPDQIEVRIRFRNGDARLILKRQSKSLGNRSSYCSSLDPTTLPLLLCT